MAEEDAPPRRQPSGEGARPRADGGRTGDQPSRPPAERPARPSGERPARSSGDRPARPSGDRPARPSGDRPARSSDDPPARSAGDRPNGPSRDASGPASKSSNDAPARKPPSAPRDESSDSAEPDTGRPDGRQSGTAEKPKLTPAKAARAALEQFLELTDRDPEAIIGIERHDDGGWTVRIEAVESRRIPDTADVLAEYELVLDAEGQLLSYARRARYARGRVRDE
jgi:Gas vesicle synthesis protein GvpO